MKPELQNTRTVEQLAEIFRQLAEEPLTSLLIAPILKFARFQSAEEAMEDLLSKGCFDDYPFEQGAESVMLAGDLACLIDAVFGKLHEKKYGSRGAEPLQITEKLLDVFIGWASYSDTQKKGVGV